MSRRRVLRIGGWVVVSCALLVGAAAAYPNGPTGLFDDVTGYQRNTADLTDGMRAEKQIDSALGSAIDRYRLKQDLRGALAHGDMRLKDAADAYLQVVAAEPDLLARYRFAIQADTDEARVAVTLLRDLFATVPLSATEQQNLLDQYHTAYHSDYPLPVPTSAGSRSAAQLP